MFIPAKRNVWWGVEDRAVVAEVVVEGDVGIMVAWLTTGLVAVVGARMAGRGD